MTGQLVVAAHTAQSGSFVYRVVYTFIRLRGAIVIYRMAKLGNCLKVPRPQRPHWALMCRFSSVWSKSIKVAGIC